jgi:CPA2 family monovalent cation:H+ antiporter-2
MRSMEAEMPILLDVVTIFGLSIGVLLLCSILRIPTIVGFLVTGVMCGPTGFGAIDQPEDVKMLAELGVVLLLFTIGLEFSLQHLMRIKRLVFLGGALQVFGTSGFVAAIFWLFGTPISQGIFYGFLIALSSTAIVLKLLQDRAQISSPHGQITLATLIFQDIAAVPMMLVVPLLAGVGEEVAPSLLLYKFAKGLLILVGVFFFAQYAVPRILHQIVRTRNQQLFLVTILFLCFSIAWITAAVGLNLALGAFLAGLIISESEYSDHTVGHILPFQNIFTSFFFVSIGMLLDLNYVIDHPFSTMAFTAIVILVKTAIATLTVIALGYPLKTSIYAALSLAQVGEFAFILSSTGASVGLIGGDNYQLFLAVSILSMALTPILLSIGPQVHRKMEKIPFPNWLHAGRVKPEDSHVKTQVKDHVIIIGMGICGKNLARVSKLAGVPYGIIEINPEVVKQQRAKGEPIFFGDATQEPVLHQVNLDDARLAVVAINDPAAARHIVETIRRLNPKIYIIARTRYLNEVKPIAELGANDVIPEEFETSIEIFNRVLRKYLIPQVEIDQFTAEVRSHQYEVLRTNSDHHASLSDLKQNLSDIEVGTYRVGKENILINKTLEQSGIRKKYGVTVLMIRHGEQVIASLNAQTEIQEGNLLVVFGEPIHLIEFSTLFKE